MNKISVSEAREGFSEIVNQVNYSGERMILERRGKAVAAVISVADLELLEMIEDRIDTEEAKKSIKEAKAKGTTTWAKLKKELGL